MFFSAVKDSAHPSWRLQVTRHSRMSLSLAEVRAEVPDLDSGGQGWSVVSSPDQSRASTRVRGRSASQAVTSRI